MNPLFKKVVKGLKAHNIEFTVEGNTIITAHCTIEVANNKVMVDDKAIELDVLWPVIAAIKGR